MLSTKQWTFVGGSLSCYFTVNRVAPIMLSAVQWKFVSGALTCNLTVTISPPFCISSRIYYKLDVLIETHELLVVWVIKISDVSTCQFLFIAILQLHVQLYSPWIVSLSFVRFSRLLIRSNVLSQYHCQHCNTQRKHLCVSTN